MSPIRRMRKGRPAKAAGVGLVTAIFLLVVLAGLALAMVNVSTSQQVSSAMDMQGGRAYQAARAGLEWGLFRQLRQDQCELTRTFVLPAQSLKTFTVTVRCVQTPTPVSPAVGASLAAPLATTLVAGNAVATVASTASLMAGMRITGAGVAVGTRIANINTGTTLTMTVPALASVTQSLTYRSALDRWQIISTACNQPDSGGKCPNTGATSPDYIQRSSQVEF